MATVRAQERYTGQSSSHGSCTDLDQIWFCPYCQALLFVPVSIWTWVTSSPVDVPVSLRFYNLSKASLPQLSGWAESKKDQQAFKLIEGFPFNFPIVTILKIKLLSDNYRFTGSWKNYCRDSLCSLSTFPQLQHLEKLYHHRYLQWYNSLTLCRFPHFTYMSACMYVCVCMCAYVHMCMRLVCTYSSIHVYHMCRFMYSPPNPRNRTIPSPQKALVLLFWNHIHFPLVPSHIHYFSNPRNHWLVPYFYNF